MLRALDAGQLAEAVLDVTDPEPLVGLVDRTRGY